MRTSILGKRWNVSFEKDLHKSDEEGYVGEKCDGYCDPPDTADKGIYIDDALNAFDTLSTIIHEFDHAAFDWLEESYVQKHGDDLARLLIKLGYVRIPERSEA